MLVSIETHITCDFSGGLDPLPLPLDPHMNFVRIITCILGYEVK